MKSWGDKSSIVFNKNYGREYKVSTYSSDKTQLSISFSSSSQGFTLLDVRLTFLKNFLFQVISEGTQSYMYMYPFSSKLPSHPGCHITLSRVPSAYNSFLLVIHFKYSSVYMSIPSSLTIPSPHTFPWQP